MVLALEHLHSCGVVYRDLKPENILIDIEGNIVLTDFGISKLVGDGQRTNSIVGTTCFMSPEVLKGEQYGKDVDWWSFGVVLYHMLTGRHPFYAKSKADTIDRVLNKKVTAFPGCPSKTAFAMIEKLLNQNSFQRLTDPQQIKKEKFFKTIDWEKLVLKKVKPPFKISVTGSHDLSNFEDEHKNKPLLTGPQDQLQTAQTGIDYFADFTFCNPNTVRSQ